MYTFELGSKIPKLPCPFSRSKGTFAIMLGSAQMGITFANGRSKTVRKSGSDSKEVWKPGRGGNDTE
jgi:hypothetical protein